MISKPTTKRKQTTIPTLCNAIRAKVEELGLRISTAALHDIEQTCQFALVQDIPLDLDHILSRYLAFCGMQQPQFGVDPSLRSTPKKTTRSNSAKSTAKSKR